MFQLLLVIIYLSFISLGLPDSLLGAAWPSMYQELNVPISYAGAISMIIAFGTIVSSLQSDRLTRRLGDLKGRGVVLREGQTLRTIYEERCALYEKYADITVDEGMYDIEQTLEILLSVLREAKIEK